MGTNLPRSGNLYHPQEPAGFPLAGGMEPQSIPGYLPVTGPKATQGGPLMDRREFVKTGAAVGIGTGLNPLGSTPPTLLIRKTLDPVVVSDVSGIRYKNGGALSSVERAFQGIVAGEDVLDALVAGVNIPELDPEESAIGFGGLPNADGVVQLDACCMHGPRKWAGGVASIEGVATPSIVAKAVAEHTDHHLLVGPGAQEFARSMGFEVRADLNTDRSRSLWLEWKRRIDPEHYLDPKKRTRHGYEVGLGMVKDGLIDKDSLWGTTHCSGISPESDLCGVTTTSGLAWKIPGRVGDSPILGAGLYVDNDVGAAGSTGRGEANLYNLTSFLVVENMRNGMSPKDAGMAALRRIKDNTVEDRLLNDRGLPGFDVRFFVLNKKGQYAGVAMYGSRESHYAVCTAGGAEEVPLEGLLDGSPT